MASYITSSAFGDLDGNCDIDGVLCTKYKSNTLGPATEIKNLSPTSVMFRVEFNFDPHLKYMINAGPSAGGYTGKADNGKLQPEKTEEPWTAEATHAQPAVSGR